MTGFRVVRSAPFGTATFSSIDKLDFAQSLIESDVDVLRIEGAAGAVMRDPPRTLSVGMIALLGDRSNLGHQEGALLRSMTEFSLPRSSIHRKEAPIQKAFRTQTQVLWALILHDIKSRFFGNGLGYVVTIIWPATHIAIILAAYVLGKRPIPYGSSPLLYASTGVLPYIAWNYMSRFTMMGMVQNKSFLAYPVIKPLDMMVARLALETVSIFIITFGLCCFNALSGVDVLPVNLSEAVCGLLSALLLGTGFGIFNAVIVMIFPLWVIGYVVILILFWFTCGMAFNPEAMPAEIGYWISWNPLMHCVEWIRKGYYADFPAHLLDKSYVLSVGAGSLALGLVMERALKRYFK